MLVSLGLLSLEAFTHLVATYGVKQTTNVPMKVLIFFVALSRLLFCSSRHFCRTLANNTRASHKPCLHVYGLHLHWFTIALEMCRGPLDVV